MTAHVASRYLYGRLFISMSVEDAKRVLGFPPGSKPTGEEISKAYKRKAIENHPDRGGEHTKMVEVNVAKDILEGKQRPDRGPAYRPDPQSPPGGWKDEDQVKKKDPIKKGVDFNTAKSRAPSGIDWKFRSNLSHGNPSKYTQDQGGRSIYSVMWVCYGQTSSHHVFMLVENAYTPRTYGMDVLYNEWAMEAVETYPLTQDLTKLAPKAIKSIVGKGKLNEGAYKLATKYTAMTSLAEEDFRSNTGGVSLKDVLIGTGLESGAESARNTVVEIAGKTDDAKRKAIGSKLKYQYEAWQYTDFTLFVNGKGYRLSDGTVENLGKSEYKSQPSKFWMYVYEKADYDYSRRRVITRMDKGIAAAVLETLEQSLVNEPPELTVQLLKTIEGLEGKKASIDRVAARWLGEANV